MHGEPKTTYRAVETNTTSDGQEYRVETRLKGPYAELREHKPRSKATLTEEQARDLRDSLNEVLDS